MSFTSDEFIKIVKQLDVLVPNFELLPEIAQRKIEAAIGTCYPEYIKWHEAHPEANEAFVKMAIIEGKIGGNSPLMTEISNTQDFYVQPLLKDQHVKVNQYSLLYGNNPILLALTKGWNHENPDPLYLRKEFSVVPNQRNIINWFLRREDLDINCIHLKNGMTPLHIACYLVLN